MYVSASELRAVIPNAYRDAALADSDGGQPDPGMLKAVIQAACTEVDALIEGRVNLPFSGKVPGKIKTAALYIALETLLIRRQVQIPDALATKIAWWRNWLSKVGEGELRALAPEGSPQAKTAGAIVSRPSIMGGGGLIGCLLAALFAVTPPTVREASAVTPRTWAFDVPDGPELESPEFLEWWQGENVRLIYTATAPESRPVRWEVIDGTNLWIFLQGAKSGKTWTWNLAPTNSALPPGRYDGRIVVLQPDGSFFRVAASQSIRIHASARVTNAAAATPLPFVAAELGRLDQRIDDITAESIGALTAETDPAFAQWLDSDPLDGFLTAEDDPAFAQWLDSDPLDGFLTAEQDPAFAQWLDGDPLDSYLTAETDPEFSAWLSTDPLAPLATTGYVDSAVAPLATTQQLADAVAPLASTGYVAAAVGAITAEGLGALTAETDPEFSAWLSAAPLAPLATTGYVDSAVAPLATTQQLADAVAPLATTQALAAAVGAITAEGLGALTAEIDPEFSAWLSTDPLAPLATTGYVGSAVAPLATTQQLADAVAPLATTGSIAAASNHFEAAVGTAFTNLGIASNALAQAISASTDLQTNYVPKATNWATAGNRTWAPWSLAHDNFRLGPFQIIPELQMYELYPPGGMGPPGVQYGGRIDIDPLDDVDVVNFRGRKWRFDGGFPASSSEVKSMAKLTPNHSFSADTDNIWELGKSAWVTDITPEPRGLLSQESTWKLEPGKSFSITNLGSYIFSMVSFAVPTDNRPVPISIFVDNQKTATFQPTPDGQTHFYNINAHAGNGSVVRMQLDDNTPGTPGADGYVLVLGETYFTGLEIFGLVKPDLYGNKISFHGQTVLVDVPEVPDAAVNLQYLDSRLRSEADSAERRVRWRSFPIDMGLQHLGFGSRYRMHSPDDNLLWKFGGNTFFEVLGAGAAVIPEIRSISIQSGGSAVITAYAAEAALGDILAEMSTDLQTWTRLPAEDIVDAHMLDDFTASITITNATGSVALYRLVDASGGDGVVTMNAKAPLTINGIPVATSNQLAAVSASLHAVSNHFATQLESIQGQIDLAGFYPTNRLGKPAAATKNLLLLDELVVTNQLTIAPDATVKAEGNFTVLQDTNTFSIFGGNAYLNGKKMAVEPEVEFVYFEIRYDEDNDPWTYTIEPNYTAAKRIFVFFDTEDAMDSVTWVYYEPTFEQEISFAFYWGADPRLHFGGWSKSASALDGTTATYRWHPVVGKWVAVEMNRTAYEYGWPQTVPYPFGWTPDP